MAGLVPAIGRGTLPLFWHSAATDGRHKAGHDGEPRFIEGGSADGRWELAMTGTHPTALMQETRRRNSG
jgi:hypothetical protein